MFIPSGSVFTAHLSWCVESPVVDGIVVSLGQELDAAVVLLVQFQNAVDDGDVTTVDLEWK